MIYRGKLIDTKSPIKLARQGERGKDWYVIATASVQLYADTKGFTAKRVADVIAITSPRVSVRHNITLATRYLETGNTQGMMLARIRALQKYDRTGIFTGPKVTAFSKALQGDTSVVVIDSWMLKAFGETILTPKIHKKLTKVTRMLATRLTWQPAETQAAIWVAIREQCGFKSTSQLLMP